MTVTRVPADLPQNRPRPRPHVVQQIDALWLHLVSRHAMGINPKGLTYEDLNKLHEDEHNGTGTIRDHSIADWTWNRDDLYQVIWEIGEMG